MHTADSNSRVVLSIFSLSCVSRRSQRREAELPMTRTTKVPTEPLVETIITETLEYGSIPNVFVYTGKHGEHKHEIDWSLRDLDPNEVTVDVADDDTLLVHGDVAGTCQRKVRVQRTTRHRRHIQPNTRTTALSSASPLSTNSVD